MLLKGVIVISIVSFTYASILPTSEEPPTLIKVVSNVEELSKENNNEKNFKANVIKRQTDLKFNLKELVNIKYASKAGEKPKKDDLSAKLLNVFKNNGDMLRRDDEEMANERMQWNGDGSKQTAGKLNPDYSEKSTNFEAGFGNDNTKLDKGTTENGRVKREDEKVIVDNCEGRLVLKYHNGYLICTEEGSDVDSNAIDIENRVLDGIGCSLNEIQVIFGNRMLCLKKKNHPIKNGLYA